MDINDYLSVLRRRWWLVLLCLLLGGAGAVVSTSRQTQVYDSQITFFLAGGDGKPVDPVSAQTAQTRLSSYATLTSSGPVLALVQTAAGRDVPVLGVAAAAIPGTIFFRVQVRSTSPERALTLARAYVQVFPDYVSGFEGTGVTLAALEDPSYNPIRITPNGRREAAVGLVLGLLLGLGVACLLELLDRRVRSTDQLERESRLALLATVPLEHTNDRLVLRAHPRSRRAEALRQVRANVQFASLERRIEILLVTSAVPGEGKTSVAADLALAAAEAGDRVVLVDADLRKPRVAEVFGIAARPGLSDVLLGTADVERALHTSVEGRLRVLPSGALTDMPSELLGSGRLGQLLEDLASDADLVVLDTAPLLPVADTMSLLAQVDAVILVAMVGRTTRQQVREAGDRLRSFQADAIGVVANGAGSTTTQYGSYFQATGAGRSVEPLVLPRRRPATKRTPARRAVLSSDVNTVPETLTK